MIEPREYLLTEQTGNSTHCHGDPKSRYLRMRTCEVDTGISREIISLNEYGMLALLWRNDGTISLLV